MKLNETKRKMLTAIAQSPRRITYFANSLSAEAMTNRLTELVEAGFLYEAESCWHITVLGRQKLDQKDTATPRVVVHKAGHYRTGDGDPFASVPRPGSSHAHLKSRGNLC